MPIFQNRLLLWMLYPLEFIYRLIISIRNWLYDHGWRNVQKLPCKVISVGNIVAGGVGKTPVVAFLADYLTQTGAQVAVLTRGYRRKRKGQILLEPKAQLPYSADDIGDEPYLLARRLKDIPIIVDRKRWRGGKLAVDRYKTEICLLDDGFQYRNLFRDLEIVVIDATAPFSNGKLLPAGLLREPLSRLQAADLIWLTRVDQASQNLTEIETQLRQWSTSPIVYSIHQPDRLIAIANGDELEPQALANQPVVAFCGIGNPESFYQTLKSLGAEIKEWLIFPDHHRYKIENLKKIRELANRYPVCRFVTTEKDGVKIRQLEFNFDNFWLLRIRIKIIKGLRNLQERLDFVLKI
ncbi:tetraacyldisaccharide 4'-kinase [candidate division KSB1 bacterium]|nr:MAG: tetraacyldisaccharide 4'-kinase [candidate division KSB1 bacterium]RKY78416.1 MAG: tetraacyldisaccharide 4'-kinase [candidate division KSB1 bacterium]RKY83988.1 MAG: tetraacyldisaccharide 4'-kinase [candidate division KSB1 bacterium]RKY87809.1 MAG: tetraacyldisaccharide 4'-kinase [candidate division KSB1 bacterium]